jgi:hypothetical protein
MVSISIAVVAMLLVVTLVSGTLAYRYRARQMRAAGQEPPSYLAYLFRPLAAVFATPVTTRVSIPRPLRILLGIIVSVGGLFFLFIAAMMLAPNENRHSSPLIMFSMVGILGALGAAFAYMGVRLIRERG